jgi:multidrug efflux pump subunit AcrB
VLEVRATWDGAAPEILESELVDKIEQAVISVEGLQEVRSTIRQGAATVELEFELERDIDAALQEVQAALSQVRLPLNVDPPIIRKNSTESEPVLRIGVSGGRSLRELMEFVDTVLLDHFQVIPGVGEVSLSGFSERNLRLWVNNEKLKQFDLTILDLQRAIELEHTELAGGYIEDAQREMNVRTMGEGLTPEEVGAILISQRGGQPIYDTTIRIRDVARVEDGLNDVRRIARVSGELGVSIGISKQRGSNEVKVGQAVKARMAELQVDPAGRHEDAGQRRLHAVRGGGGEGHGARAAAGRHPDRAHLLPVPGHLQLRLQHRAVHPDLRHRHLHDPVLQRVHPEHLHPARAGAGHRHRGG